MPSSKKGSISDAVASSGAAAVCVLPNGVQNNTSQPYIITPEEVPYARLILRRDRVTHFYDIGVALEQMHIREQVRQTSDFVVI